MDDRESFVMYRSFVDALEMLSYESYGQAMRAINRYAIYGEIPEGLPADANIVFTMAKPQLDANIKRRENGKKGAEYGRLGGRPKKDKNPIGDIDKNPIGVTEKTPNVNVNVNENVNVYIHIRDMYNEICVSFPKVKTLSEKRKKAISARLKVYTEEDFKTLFTKAESSPFLKGANTRNWVATFDWLICDANMAKVLDGNYDDHKTVRKNAFNNFQQTTHDFDELEKMLIAN